MVLLAGFIGIPFGAALYISAGLGAGPRDSFQLAVSHTLHLPAGVARTFIRALTAGDGWLLGGNLSWGIGLAVVLLGPWCKSRSSCCTSTAPAAPPLDHRAGIA